MLDGARAPASECSSFNILQVNILQFNIQHSTFLSSPFPFVSRTRFAAASAVLQVKTLRRRAVGAEVVDGGVHFRVWAPGHRSVRVAIDGHEHEMEHEGDGFFAAFIETAAGALYRFRLDDARHGFPDPASRFQPEGPHGPSMVVDPATYTWDDRAWRGVSTHGLVIYELHIGTFTRDGTWRAAQERLGALAVPGL